ncbi:hypothetical protein GGS20DRAFT_454827 [Poronia punctata]|nr:hypothetical protein GGS20DRAFT_454827 [Poronia punctata]
MRLHVAILYGLLAGLVGAENIEPRQAAGVTPQTNPRNTAIWVKSSKPSLNATKGIIDLYTSTQFAFGNAKDVAIKAVNLKRFNTNGASDGSDDASIRTLSIVPHLPAGTQPNDDLLSQMPDESGTTIVRFTPGLGSQPWILEDFMKPLYLELQWQRNSGGTYGTSTTRLFAVVDNQADVGAAIASLNAAVMSDSSSALSAPSRPEALPSKGTTSSTQSTAATTTTTTTGKAAPTKNPSGGPGSGGGGAAPSPGVDSEEPATAEKSSSGGLSKNSIIGIAVGVGGGGLLIAGLLAWFFFIRRRRNSNDKNVPSQQHQHQHQELQSYASDKDMPVVVSSAPYSDRASTPPTPGHYPSPTDSRPTVKTPYAHLVEEGMTPDEIRRLEEEERQLDAAIENAGRSSRSP